MEKIIRTIICIASVLLVTGCGKEEAEDIPSNGILIEAEAPRTNGWSTEDNIGTRSHDAKTSRQEGEDGLDMEISTQPEVAERQADGATTRWTNLDDNIIFRIVAYKSATAAGISASNYAGYGDYRLSGTVVQTVKSLAVPAGTYTFVCYSYGNANAIPAFNSSLTSVSASNGQNFMTCVKPNITINNIGSKYTLSNIVFKHHCARYRVQAIAQSGRMGNVTACTGSVTLPNNSATYTFTNGVFKVQAATGSTNVTWSSPNAMSVYSNYTYLLPQSSVSITVKLNPTIGGKAFTNKSTTLSGLTFAANKTYRSDVSFTTTEGYIVGGAFWAKGNLYYNNGSFAFYATTTECSTNRSQDFWRWDALRPDDAFGNSSTTWNPARDPCRKISNWRLPTMQEFHSLIQVSSTYTTMNGKKGVKFSNILFLPCTGFFPGHAPNTWQSPDRGFYWSQNRVDDLNYGIGFHYGIMLDFDFRGIYAPRLNGSDKEGNGWPIRCVRAD